MPFSYIHFLKGICKEIWDYEMLGNKHEAFQVSSYHGRLNAATVKKTVK